MLSFEVSKCIWVEYYKDLKPCIFLSIRRESEREGEREWERKWEKEAEGDFEHLCHIKVDYWKCISPWRFKSTKVKKANIQSFSLSFLFKERSPSEIPPSKNIDNETSTLRYRESKKMAYTFVIFIEYKDYRKYHHKLLYLIPISYIKMPC